jgi:hypothetical protein
MYTLLIQIKISAEYCKNLHALNHINLILILCLDADLIMDRPKKKEVLTEFISTNRYTAGALYDSSK